MATKTKSGGSTIALVLALAAGAGIYFGVVKRVPSDERLNVLFTVVFEPEQRLTLVDIVLFVNGVAKQSESTKNSPWNAVVQMRKGQTATLKATQSVPSKLSCAVQGVVQETREFPGSVTCTHKRV